MMLAVRRKKPGKPSYGPPSFGSSRPSKDKPDLLKFMIEATRNLPTWNGKDLKEGRAEAVESGSGPICSVKKVDAVAAAAAAETLTEEDTRDIVRRVRDFLRKQGPSQESELLAVLRPQQVRRLQASFDSLAALVERLPGFHHVREDRYSFLYYLSPEEDDCCSAPPAAALPDTRPPEEPVAGGSDEGAEQAGPGGKRDACSQTPCYKRAELECEVKDRALEVAKLEQKLEAMRMDQARKREALRVKIEQHRILQVTLPPMPSFCEEEDEEDDKKGSVGEKEGEKEQEGERPEAERTQEAGPEEEDTDPETSCDSSAEVEEEEEDLMPPGLFRRRVPDFYDLHLQLLERSSSSDTEGSLWSRWGSPTTNGGGNKAEGQIAKIVKMLIKKEPNYTEVEMRGWVDEVRRLKGGFSRLTLSTIVAMVLDHMRMHCLLHCRKR